MISIVAMYKRMANLELQKGLEMVMYNLVGISFHLPSLLAALTSNTYFPGGILVNTALFSFSISIQSGL